MALLSPIKGARKLRGEGDDEFSPIKRQPGIKRFQEEALKRARGVAKAGGATLPGVEGGVIRQAAVGAPLGNARTQSPSVLNFARPGQPAQQPATVTGRAQINEGEVGNEFDPGRAKRIQPVQPVPQPVQAAPVQPVVPQPVAPIPPLTPRAKPHQGLPRPRVGLTRGLLISGTGPGDTLGLASVDG